MAIRQLFDHDYGFGFVHVKGVDDAGHDRDAKLKVQQLEKVDSMLAVISQCLAQRNEQVSLAIICYFRLYLSTAYSCFFA
jgi:2,3-bisphosphoglycerate-independent phosphoglycerate mutase